MNLNKSGTRPDLIAQDFDTLQRTIQALQSQLTALTTKVNTPAAVPAPVIAPSGSVTVYNKSGLTSVTHDATLIGQGTATSPLSVTLPVNFLVGSLLVSDTDLKNATAHNNFIAGVTHKFIVPLMLADEMDITANGGVGVNTNGIKYHGTAQNAFGAWTVITPGTGYRFTTSQPTTLNIQSVTDLIGLGLDWPSPAASAGAGHTSASGLHVSVYYALLDCGTDT